MKSDFLIIANSSDFLIAEILHEAAKDKTIIALDGAVNKLTPMGIKPHIILGDFDSINREQRHYFGINATFSELDDNADAYCGKHDVMIVPQKNQNYTDLSKGILYCDKQNASSITIVCATGGRLDLHHDTMRALENFYSATRPIALHTEQQTLCVISDATVVLTGEIGDKCGIIPTAGSSFTTNGLLYDVVEYTKASTCNALDQANASVNVNGSALMIMPAQLQSQREYMGKTDEERLVLRLRDARASFSV